jgi:hypothetical protein
MENLYLSLVFRYRRGTQTTRQQDAFSDCLNDFSENGRLRVDKMLFVHASQVMLSAVVPTGLDGR